MAEAGTDAGNQGANTAAVAANAAAGANGGGNNAAPVQIDWPTFVKTGVPEEFRTQASQFKDPGALFKSLNDTRAAAEKPFVVPKPDAPADVIQNFRKRMGIPETVEGYTFKHHKDGGAFDDADKAFQGKIAQAAHKHHLRPDQLTGMNEAWNEVMAAHEEAKVAADKQFATENEAALRKAWGKDTDARKAVVSDFIRRQATELGIKPEDILNVQMKNERFVGDYAPLLQILYHAASAFEQGGAPKVMTGDEKQSANSRINEIHSWQHGTPEQRVKYAQDATQKELRDLYAQTGGDQPIR